MVNCACNILDLTTDLWTYFFLNAHLILYAFYVKIANLMDRFETQFENLDVQSQVMEGAMSGSSTLTTPQGEVDALMVQVADEAG